MDFTSTPHLELKTRPRLCSVSLSLPIKVVNLVTLLCHLSPTWMFDKMASLVTDERQSVVRASIYIELILVFNGDVKPGK